MKKSLVILMLMVATIMPLSAQKKQVYNPEADAMEQIYNAVSQARNEGKFVLCQVGGNWCPWCLRLADFMEKEKSVKDVLDSHYVYIHINHSRENKNLEVLNRLHRPERFHFPVLVVLDADGEVLHIQSTECLESGKGYSKEKVLEFLRGWTRKATMPDNLLTVMSFNIRNSSAYIEDGPNAWSFRKETVGKMIRIEDPDLIGFQELLPDQVAFLDSSLPDYRRVGVGRDDGNTQGEMMAIYYRAGRYELLQGETRWLSVTPRQPSFGWDAACRRTVTIAHLRDRKDGQELVYLNTHLDHMGQEARRESILLLCEIIEYYGRKDIPVILGGDMNSDLQSEIFTPLKDHRMLSARATAELSDNQLTYTGYGKGTPSQIDHFFTRNMQVKQFRTLTRDYGVPYISDHYPIKALIKIGEGEE